MIPRLNTIDGKQGNGGISGNLFLDRKKDSGRTAVFFEKVFLLGYSKKLCNVLGGYKYILTNI